MLALKIVDKELNQINYLYLEKSNDNKNRFHGFTIKDTLLTKFDTSSFNILNMFILGKNQKDIGMQDGYKVILDLDSNLYHFFKYGKEDFEKLYYYNGEYATMHNDEPIKGKTESRKFIFKVCRLVEFATISLFIQIITYQSLTILHNNLNSHNNNTEIITETVSESITKPIWYTVDEERHIAFLSDDFLGHVTFSFEDEEAVYVKGITADDIKDAIYRSSALDEKEKDFLWNEQLITDLIPYYKGTNYDILTRIKHREIDIIPFTEEEINDEANPTRTGYYSGDNVLHIRNYNSNTLEISSDMQGCVGHEYIHLLQGDSPYDFLRESVAEIMSHEYFLNCGDLTYDYSYSDACRYTKVLMEIVGTDPIMKTIFSDDPTNLEEEIKTYFTEEDCNEFLDTIKLSPYYHKPNYSRLEELLAILYKNKFNSDMQDNPLIMNILENQEHNRIYFNSDLMNTNPSYYTISETKEYSFKEAVEQNLIYFYEIRCLNENQFLNHEYSDSDIIKITVDFKCKEGYYIKSADYEFEGKEIKGRLKIVDEDSVVRDISVSEAIARGYVTIENYYIWYKLKHELSLNSTGYMPNGYKINGIEVTCIGFCANGCKINQMDGDNETFMLTVTTKSYIDSINKTTNLPYMQ